MTANTFLGVGRTTLPLHPMDRSLLAPIIVDLSLLPIMDRSLLVLLPTTDLSLRSRPIHPYHPCTLDSPSALDDTVEADGAARPIGGTTVITGIVDLVVITDPVVITDMEDVDLVTAAIVVLSRKIHTRILLARVAKTQRPMSPCTVSVRRFHLRIGRPDFLPLKQSTRPRKTCIAPRSGLSELERGGPTQRICARIFFILRARRNYRLTFLLPVMLQRLPLGVRLWKSMLILPPD